ncbi:IS3 family transposase [Micromonospora sp. NBC_01699]|uniref:IS3 family transposase n=1 Tax=Micromonospora sp. NBC_01699 TaxID=2975984 RepID=UPI003FA5557E
MFAYIDAWYNTRRIQKELGYLSPDEYETAWHTHQNDLLEPDITTPLHQPAAGNHRSIKAGELTPDEAHAHAVIQPPPHARCVGTYPPVVRRSGRVTAAGPQRSRSAVVLIRIRIRQALPRSRRRSSFAAEVIVNPGPVGWSSPGSVRRWCR